MLTSCMKHGFRLGDRRATAVVIPDDRGQWRRQVLTPTIATFLDGEAGWRGRRGTLIFIATLKRRTKSKAFAC